jgi:hypothetical protein
MKVTDGPAASAFFEKYFELPGGLLVKVGA